MYDTTLHSDIKAIISIDNDYHNYDRYDDKKIVQYKNQKKDNVIESDDSIDSNKSASTIESQDSDKSILSIESLDSPIFEYNKKNIKKNKKKNDLKTLLRLFPRLNNKNDAVNLKIDNDSLYYISIREYADQISNIIIEYANRINVKSKEIIITDSTAGVGGNTISFCKYFKKVYAIEIDKKRAKYLKNNLDVYNLTNIEIIENNCINVLDKIENHDVVFIDPPWGGKNYKNYEKLKLKISDTPIEMLCNNLMNQDIMKKIPKMIILKLPNNYDIVNLYTLCNGKYIFTYNLNKMTIVVIIT